MIRKKWLQRLSVLPVVGIALAGIAVAAPTTAQAACAGTGLFAVGGYNDPTGTLAFGKAADGARQQGYHVELINYSANVPPIIIKPALDQSVAEGETKLKNAVNGFHAACPGSHILISGYSEGALVAGNVIADYADHPTIPYNQIDGVLYGDPRRWPADGVGGIMGNFPNVIPGMHMTGYRGFGNKIGVHEICNQNDGICHSENMITNVLGFANGVQGYLQGDHGYNIDPLNHRGNYDTVYPQAPKINYGPALPLPIGTPYEIQKANPWLVPGYMNIAIPSLTNALGTTQASQLSQDPWFGPYLAKY